jgi:hypothetical protein
MGEAQNIMEHNRDGSVSRRFVCECGNSVYKKNLTTGAIEFLARQGANKITPIPLDNVSQVEIMCPACKTGHLLVDVKEGVGISEEHFIHTDVAK